MTSSRYPLFASLLILIAMLISGCERPSSQPAARATLAPFDASGARLSATPTLMPTATAAPTSVPERIDQASESGEDDSTAPTPYVSPTPISVEDPSALCGSLLPVQLNRPPSMVTLQPGNEALQQVFAQIPAAAREALQRVLDSPESVGLAAYRVGQESDGVFLNADATMPLASVVKLIHLAAYAEAVASGQLDPNTIVPLADLDNFYLPGLDLGAHAAALRELEEDGRITTPSGLRLEEIPWMMIRHSANSATDYLHMLLGQEQIEQTVIELSLDSQTAPCPFLGQFLAMQNHTQGSASGNSVVQQYIDHPELYARDVMLLTDAYSSDDAFRAAERNARGRRPMTAQRLFTENLNPQGSARDYAQLMAKIAQNGLSNAESSFQARRYLEWPMRFEANQELFTNLGYKNGAMPGVLTTAYYAYPIDGTAPVVVILFFRDLPNRTYQRWRSSALSHDELARWLLIDSDAIPLLRSVLMEN